MQRLEVLHNHCVRGILGGNRVQQWRDHISSGDLTMQFGMSNGLNVLVTQYWLQWVGHEGRMNDHLPIILAHGPKLRWRDLVLKGIHSLGFDTLNCFNAAQDRP